MISALFDGENPMMAFSFLGAFVVISSCSLSDVASWAKYPLYFSCGLVDILERYDETITRISYYSGRFVSKASASIKHMGSVEHSVVDNNPVNGSAIVAPLSSLRGYPLRIWVCDRTVFRRGNIVTGLVVVDSKLIKRDACEPTGTWWSNNISIVQNPMLICGWTFADIPKTIR
jgi:hypothetical protein